MTIAYIEKYPFCSSCGHEGLKKIFKPKWVIYKCVNCGNEYEFNRTYQHPEDFKTFRAYMKYKNKLENK